MGEVYEDVNYNQYTFVCKDFAQIYHKHIEYIVQFCRG
jgi:hypothetical protein